MSDRRFALVDFTYRGKTGRLRFHEAGHIVRHQLGRPKTAPQPAARRSVPPRLVGLAGNHTSAEYV